MAQKDEKVPDPPEVSDKDCTPRRRIKTKEAAYSEELVKDINVIFLTVTNDEYGAVVAKTEEIMNGKPLTEVIKNEVMFLIGTFGHYRVAIMQTKSGQQEILILLPKLLQLIKAKYIVSIGMCYGMNQQKYRFGDVIVANEIIDFNHAHRGEDGTKFEVKQHQIEGTILPMFRSANGFELERFKDREDYVDVEVGPVAAQTSVVKNEDYKKDIQRQAPYALIGEMEGGAIVLATRHMNPRPEVIVIKGIADWGDGNKESSRKWQKFASHAAASFVHFRMTQNSEALKKEIIPAATVPAATQEQAMDEDCLIWKKSPEVLDVHKILRSKSDDWIAVGRDLKVPANKLSGLTRDITLTNDSKLETILRFWAESYCSPVTWKNLYQVLIELPDWKVEAGKVYGFVHSEEAMAIYSSKPDWKKPEINYK